MPTCVQTTVTSSAVPRSFHNHFTRVLLQSFTEVYWGNSGWQLCQKSMCTKFQRWNPHAARQSKFTVPSINNMILHQGHGELGRKLVLGQRKWNPGHHLLIASQLIPLCHIESHQRWGLQRPGSKSRPLFAKNSDSNIGTTAATWDLNDSNMVTLFAL